MRQNVNLRFMFELQFIKEKISMFSAASIIEGKTVQAVQMSKNKCCPEKKNLITLNTAL